MFTEALFIIAKKWKQTTCTSVGMWMNGYADTAYPQWDVTLPLKGMQYWHDYNVGDSRKQRAKRERPNTQRRLLYGSIYMEYSEQANPQTQRVRRLPAAGGRGAE